MQLQTILFTLLSAGALALPTSTPSSSNTTEFTSTSNATESTLEKRSHYGWVGSYGKTDYTCKGSHFGARPKMDSGGCYKFHPGSDNVGIYWGSWPLSFAGLDTFSDDNCQNQVGGTILQPGFPSAEGPGTCVSVRLHGGGIDFFVPVRYDANH
ncbi:hypothetical protein G7Y79_00029g063120 [Physcia stellaris]|nr:hypothetical protein G7Y79_00029g063120 [Physcia stellaris]